MRGAERVCVVNAHDARFKKLCVTGVVPLRLSTHVVAGQSGSNREFEPGVAAHDFDAVAVGRSRRARSSITRRASQASASDRDAVLREVVPQPVEARRIVEVARAGNRSWRRREHAGRAAVVEEYERVGTRLAL